MRRSSIAQIGGSSIVLAALIASESFIYLLDQFPASETIWFIHLDVLGVFIFFRDLLASADPIVHLDLVRLSAPLALAAMASVIGASGTRLLVAVVANLSLGVALLLTQAWLLGRVPHGLLDLVNAAGRRPAEALLVGIILLSGLTAAAASHMSFIADIMDTRRARGFAHVKVPIRHNEDCEAWLESSPVFPAAC